jgi:hypothetical protein
MNEEIGPHGSETRLIRESDRALVVKFAVLVGLAGIFVDAVIAHGLFWDNDPYWTYWITKTFLIATVFAVGISLIGVGVWQGAVVTGVHTLILEVYYDWFAPVGLPQEPEWLDFNHIWVSGTPAHFLAIFTGFLAALWLWRRNNMPENLNTSDSRGNLSVALLAAALVLVLDGLITHGLLMKQFPGWTYFIQHLLVTTVFVLGWGAYAGFDLTGCLTGSVTLALLWVAYAMYVGPSGLPVEVRYLGYEELWLKAFPGGLAAALVGLFAASRLLKAKLRPATLLVGALSLLLIGTAQAQGLKARGTATGSCMQIVGPDPVDMKNSLIGTGSITVATVEKGNRWSHVQNTDEMNVQAKWNAGGITWEVMIDTPMPRHPRGKYTVWNGVVYRHEMHGHTGIGTNKLPLMKPEIALWGWAKVKKNGREISRMSPAHAMVTKEGDMKGVMLEISTEDKDLIGAPDGYLTVMWHEIESIEMPDREENQRTTAGWTVLIAMPLVLLWLAARARSGRYSHAESDNDSLSERSH